MTKQDDTKTGTDAPEDLSDLSRRFVDLWQEQARLMAQDPATAQVMAQASATMTQMLSGLWSPMEQGSAPGMPFPVPPFGPHATQRETRDDQTGTEASAAASGERDRLLHELLERLGRIEQRLDTLAPQAEGKGGSAAKRPRKKTPARKGTTRKPRAKSKS